MSYNKLGRGLSSLIPDGSYFDEENIVVDDKKKNTMNDEDIEYLKIPVGLIVSNKMQPRKYFDESSIQELAQSIKNNGVIQPIVVRKIKDKNLYEIVAGERRWRASKSIGIETIPAIIKNITDKEFLELSIVENIQREDINPIEEAEAYKRLMDEFYYTHENISEMIGKSRTYITNIIRILSLPASVQKLVKNKSLTIGHAKIIVNVEDVEKIAQIIVEKSLSVRQTESLVKSIAIKKQLNYDKLNDEKNEDLILLEEKISENLGMCVKIKDNNNIGTVCINFRNLEELNIILRKLS